VLTLGALEMAEREIVEDPAPVNPFSVFPFPVSPMPLGELAEFGVIREVALDETSRPRTEVPADCFEA
jgi:hypothetical protein